jgi:hypothetical protein
MNKPFVDLNIRRSVVRAFKMISVSDKDNGWGDYCTPVRLLFEGTKSALFTQHACRQGCVCGADCVIAPWNCVYVPHVEFR